MVPFRALLDRIIDVLRKGLTVVISIEIMICLPFVNMKAASKKGGWKKEI
jgi:hypothetical protein